MDLQPFNIVNKPGFLRKYQEYHPQYEIPSSKFISERIDIVHEKIKNRVKEIIDNDNPSTSTISIDGWSAKHHGYMGINRHYIDSNFKRKKFNIGCSPFDKAHTAINIWNNLNDVLIDWNFTPYLALRDSAHNLIAAFDNEDCNFESTDDILHSLQTVVKKGVLKLVSVENLETKVKKVSSYASHSIKFSTELTEQQKLLDPQCSPLVLEKFCPTRWNIIYYIFKRMLQLRRPLVNTLMEAATWPGYKKSIINEIELTQNDFRLMEQVVEVLEPFEEATKMLSNSKACISAVIPVVTTIILGLEEIISGSERGVKGMAKNLKSQMETKFLNIETDKKYYMATALDVNYKCSFFRSDDTKSLVKNNLINELSEKFTSEDFDNIAQSNQHFRKSPDTPRSKFTSLSFAERMKKIRDKSNKKLGASTSTSHNII